MTLKPRKPASRAAPVSRIFEVRNAARLQDLCGPHHRHLQLLENRLAAYDLRAESQGGGI
ncbi:MAG: phosphate starvation-inducible PhoH-like protein, partial [Hyphomonas sp.]